MIWNSPSREACDFFIHAKGVQQSNKEIIACTTEASFSKKMWNSQYQFFKIWNLPALRFLNLVCIPNSHDLRWADLAGAGSVRPWKWSFNPRCSTGCNGHDVTDNAKKNTTTVKQNQTYLIHPPCCTSSDQKIGSKDPSEMRSKGCENRPWSQDFF